MTHNKPAARYNAADVEHSVEADGAGHGKVHVQEHKVVTERLKWPDAAKGLSIVGVALLHVCLEVPHGMDTWLAGLNHLLDPLRMPLFFLVSGYFSVKVLRFSLREVLSKRIWFFFLPYLVWMPIYLFIKEFEMVRFADFTHRGAGWVAMSVLSGEGMYWFLYCLAVFCLFAWATRSLSNPVAVALSLTPLLLQLTPVSASIVLHFGQYLPIYMIGLRYRSAITWLARSCTRSGFIVTYVLSGLAAYTAHHWWQESLRGTALAGLPGRGEGRWGWSSDFFDLIEGLVWRLWLLPTAVLLAVALASVPLVFSALAFVGRHTLVVYIGHPIALSVLFGMLLRYREGVLIEPGNGVWASPSLWVIGVFIVVMIACYGFYLLSRVPVIGWTLAPPAIDHLLPGAAQRSAATSHQHNTSSATPTSSAPKRP
ncbi:Acyltransferase family protein [Corynebacterium ciconiae DSM 44920]|uniref:acyltransferase family protein n=1 Tax=Corynebacterium ciconiae TaxID=227319 RepID=UPI0003817B39|nr:acyltransferase family protein [Corynebacterium ciconiae]WKD60765.1 Acyltransferase family protein [Corynebacterium ciconiae DSM 44920]